MNTRTKTTAQIDANIVAIKVKGAELDGMIQECGIDVITHFAAHKNNGVVNRLYAALPRGARASAFTSWLLMYSNAVANTNMATKKAQPFVYSADKVADIEGATTDMWYNHKPDPAPDQVLDLQAAIKAILKKAASAPGLKNGDRETLKALAKCVNIAESDVPSLPVKAEVITPESIV